MSTPPDKSSKGGEESDIRKETALRRGRATAGINDAGGRLDTFVAAHSGLSRNRAQKLVTDGKVLVNGAPAKKNHVLVRGESVSWEIPPPEPEEVLPQEIPLKIAFEDEHLVVIDKPADMVMYPGPGHTSETLLNALLARYPDIAGVGGKGRPGIFHRLDKGTSGLVAVARSENAYRAMVEMMADRRVERTYISLVVGSIPAASGKIEAPMGRSRSNKKRMAIDRFVGRYAVTRFKVLERFGREFTLVEVSLETGRTHQIRVHFSHIGHPVAGDPDYSRGKASRRLGLRRQFLHACRLEFIHPISGETLTFESELPDDLCAALEQLRS